MVRARLIPGGGEKEVSVEGRIKVRDLLRALGFSSEEAVVIKSGTPLTEEDYLEPGDEVEVVRVLSGGFL